MGSLEVVQNSFKDIVIGGESRVHLGNVINQTAPGPNKPDSEKYQECLRGLFLTNPRDDLASIRRSKGSRVEGTCEWILTQEDYINWSTTNTAQLLRLVGPPGIGKSMLSSFLVEHLEKDPTDLLYYFCDNKQDKRNSASSIIRVLLWQLLSQRPALFEYVKADYDSSEPGSLFTNFDALWRILVKVIEAVAKAERLCILIDALDECDESSRRDLLEHIKIQVCKWAKLDIEVKIILTSRAEVDIEEIFVDPTECISLLAINSGRISSDLMSFISVKTADIIRRKNWSSKWEEKIASAMNDQSGGTFLWASLVLDDISRVKTAKLINDKLDNLPSGITQIYDRILEAIDEEYVETAKRVLQWVVVAQRPLTVTELAAFQSLHPSVYTGRKLPTKDDIEDFRDGYKTCISLIERDTETDTIHLIHQSVKDYLLSSTLQESESLSHYHVDFNLTHLLAFEACCRILCCEELDGFEVDMLDEDYLTHLKAPWWDKWGDFFDFLYYIIEEISSHCSFIPHYLFDYFTYFEDLRTYRPEILVGWLEVAILTAKNDIAVRLIEEFPEIVHLQTVDGLPVLYHATTKGNPAVVKLLLDNGAVIEGVTLEEAGAERETPYKGGPLHIAADYGHESVVQLLLENGAKIEAVDSSPSTALSISAYKGHETVARILLSYGAKIDECDVFRAAYSGSVELLKLLVDHDANLNVIDNDGDTPLIIAAQDGHTPVVTFLLEHGAGSDDEDDEGDRALLLAAYNGHVEIVQLLLQSGIGVAGVDGDTPLAAASKEGHTSVVRLLLEHGAASDEDYGGDLALLRAGYYGHTEIVRLLLESGIDVSTQDNTKASTLHFAVRRCFEDIVRLLLEHGIELEKKDNRGSTPLHDAAGSGFEAITRVLLEKGAKTDAKNVSSWTPLHYAANNGHEEIVRLLLNNEVDDEKKTDNGDTSSRCDGRDEHVSKSKSRLSSADNDGRTPLWLAAKSGHEAVVKLLLIREEVDPDARNIRTGQTPLWCAAKNGYETIVSLLLSKDQVDPNAKDTETGQTPLWWAAKFGYERIIKILLARHDIDPNLRDTENGRTPLSRAAGNGHESIVRLLLARTDIDPDSRDTKTGRTPLSRAAGNGHESVVKLLLARRDVDPDSRDSKTGQTPLSWAARNGRVEVVRLLLARDDVDLKSKDAAAERTPLMLAAAHGHWEVVELLRVAQRW